MTAHPIDTEALREQYTHLVEKYGPEAWAESRAHVVLSLLDALAAAEHRATRAEAQSAIRGRAVAIYRERARKAESERDQARAQADRVRALHQPQTLTSLIDDDCANEMCDHEDYCPTDSTAVVCAECDRVAEAGSPYYGENGVEAALYPCPTIRALDGDA